MVCIMTFFIVVVVDNQGRVFTTERNLVGGARCIDTGGGDRIFASLLSVFVTLFFLLLLPSLLIGGVDVFGSQ